MAKVNLDALILKEDFEIDRTQENAPIKKQINLRELERGEFFFSALRKPDFQRETDDWDPQRVVDLIGTFLNDDLIPAVVLWRNKDLYFVIDGAHRLSALIAWVQDDYGSGEFSQKFFNYNVPMEQTKIAERTRELAHKQFGTYAQHKDASVNPDRHSEEIRTRAKRLGASLNLELQWVRGESSADAIQSFKRINQRSAIISPQEFHLLETRKKPMTIAARAILRRGAGNKLWDARRSEIESLSKEVYDILFTPPLQSPLKTADVPLGGSPYASNVLVTMHEFVKLCVVDSDEAERKMSQEDPDGELTVECLSRTRRVARLLCSSHPSSVGIHPAIYCYSWTGKHQPILFLTIASLLMEYAASRQLDTFVQCRKSLEEFLTQNRALVNQVIRKFGSKNPEQGKLRGFYTNAIEAIRKGVLVPDVVTEMRKTATYSFLQPGEVAYTPGEKRGKGFSTGVRSGVMFNNILATTPHCLECGGVLPIQSQSVDHGERREDGGNDTAENAEVLHPYCNTGHKEKRVSKSKAPSGRFDQGQ